MLGGIEGAEKGAREGADCELGAFLGAWVSQKPRERVLQEGEGALLCHVQLGGK